MLDKSLQNLGMDYVDLYIYHMWDYRTPLYDIMEGLNRMPSRRARHAISASPTASPGSCARPMNWPAEEGFAPFISVQGHYNLIFREEEREMVQPTAGRRALP